MARTLAVLVSFVCLAHAAAASSASEIVRNAIEQMRAAEALRAEVIISNDEDLRASTEVRRSSIMVNLDGEHRVAAYRTDTRVSGRDMPRGMRVVLTNDGSEAQLLEYASKSEQRVPAESSFDDPLFELAQSPLDWIEMLTAPGVDLSGDAGAGEIAVRAERFGRHECDVVRLVDNEEMSVEVFFSRSSGLPVLLKYMYADGLRLVTRINKLNLNARVPDSALRIKPAPRGFTSLNRGQAGSGGAPGGKVEVTDARVGTDIGDRAPGWTLTDTDGKAHSLEDYLGEVVLLDFWAVGCPPCRASTPALKSLHEKYADQGLRVVGINAWNETRGMIVGYERSQRVEYTLLLDGGSVAAQYGVKGIPDFFVIGKDGAILSYYPGYNAQLERELEKSIRVALGLDPEPLDADEDEDELEDFEDY